MRGEQIEHDVGFICGAAKRVVAGADDASGLQSAFGFEVQRINEKKIGRRLRGGNASWSESETSKLGVLFAGS